MLEEVDTLWFTQACEEKYGAPARVDVRKHMKKLKQLLT